MYTYEGFTGSPTHVGHQPDEVLVHPGRHRLVVLHSTQPGLAISVTGSTGTEQSPGVQAEGAKVERVDEAAQRDADTSTERTVRYPHSSDRADRQDRRRWLTGPDCQTGRDEQVPPVSRQGGSADRVEQGLHRAVSVWAKPKRQRPGVPRYGHRPRPEIVAEAHIPSVADREARGRFHIGRPGYYGRAKAPRAGPAGLVIEARRHTWLVRLCPPTGPGTTSPEPSGSQVTGDHDR